MSDVGKIGAVVAKRVDVEDASLLIGIEQKVIKMEHCEKCQSRYNPKNLKRRRRHESRLCRTRGERVRAAAR